MVSLLLPPGIALIVALLGINVLICSFTKHRFVEQINDYVHLGHTTNLCNPLTAHMAILFWRLFCVTKNGIRKL